MASKGAPVADAHGQGHHGGGIFNTIDGRTVEIRNVWDYNLEEEMANIREIIEDYPYIGMVG